MEPVELDNGRISLYKYSEAGQQHIGMAYHDMKELGAQYCTEANKIAKKTTNRMRRQNQNTLKMNKHTQGKSFYTRW